MPGGRPATSLGSAGGCLKQLENCLRAVKQQNRQQPTTQVRPAGHKMPGWHLHMSIQFEVRATSQLACLCSRGSPVPAYNCYLACEVAELLRCAVAGTVVCPALTRAVACVRLWVVTSASLFCAGPAELYSHSSSQQQ
jgi:hypothetical protein